MNKRLTKSQVVGVLESEYPNAINLKPGPAGSRVRNQPKPGVFEVSYSLS